MTYKLIDTETLYHICVKNNYYTCGTNAEYNNLFIIAKNNKCINKNDYIYNIATDIFYHSDGIKLNNIIKVLKKHY